MSVLHLNRLVGQLVIVRLVIQVGTVGTDGTDGTVGTDGTDDTVGTGCWVTMICQILLVSQIGGSRWYVKYFSGVNIFQE